MLINDADDVRLGTTEVDRVYSGSVLVWQRAPQGALSVSLTVNDPQYGAYVRAKVTTTGDAPDQYKYYLSVNNGAWSLKYTGAATQRDIATSWSSTNQVKVESYLEGQLIATAFSNKVTTGAAPPPATVQKQVTLSPASMGSYKGDNTRNTYNGGGSTRFYVGNYTPGPNGRQKSSFHFNIPADVRWCKKIDKVEFRLDNDWTYGGTGFTQYLAITHTKTAGTTWPGSTGHMSGRATARYGWYGGVEWVNITNDVDPNFKLTVAENFRTKSAWGICIVAPNDNIGYYGYYSNSARLRITYTVYT